MSTYLKIKDYKCEKSILKEIEAKDGPVYIRCDLIEEIAVNEIECANEKGNTHYSAIYTIKDNLYYNRFNTKKERDAEIDRVANNGFSFIPAEEFKFRDQFSEPDIALDDKEPEVNNDTSEVNETLTDDEINDIKDEGLFDEITEKIDDLHLTLRLKGTTFRFKSDDLNLKFIPE